ncbi:MAG: HigA family addiction module antidote protein [Lachnospiraceae bacterium]|nr:HigA family addiction module antidote protein [Lachnospiraceae bacterium]
MSNYIEYNDKIAFHPGYYLKEIIEESGLTQEDFAKRMGTTPKNLSILIRGEQNLSIDMASKLSRMLGTTIAYWLGLQQAYDEKVAEFLSEEELKREREVFKLIDYKYFIDNFNFPNLPRKVDEQIKCVREFLAVSSLTVLQERNLAVSYRSYTEEPTMSNVVNANVMVQIAINRVLKTETPKFNRKKFEKAVLFALSQTKNHDGFLYVVKKAFQDAGVVLVVLPNLKNSGIYGATKKVDGKVLLMVNDRRHYADTFWFTLFHEIGHILNSDLGITFKAEAEDEADQYAKNMLIPREKYEEFIDQNHCFDERTIVEFAESINQDPGIVLGRLMKDEIVEYTETYLSKKLRHTYKVVIV